jgi:lipase ATG15
MPSRNEPTVWLSLSKTLFVLGIFAQVAFIVRVIYPYAGYDLLRDTPYIEQTKPITESSDGLTLRHIYHHGAGQPGPRARRLDITSPCVHGN